jgi:DNA-binding winged helix-turn-helix (wHTH) protein
MQWFILRRPINFNLVRFSSYRRAPMQRLLDASVEAVPTKPRPVNFGRIGGRWETLRRSGNSEPFPAGEDSAAGDANVARWQAADAALEFGRFRVFLRRRQLVADGVPVKLGTRTFDLLLALLESDGSLVTKDKLLSRVWSGFVVCEENLKVQINALREALGDDRELIRTEFGRGYRFTGVVHAAATGRACPRLTRRGETSQRSLPQWASWQPPHVGWASEPCFSLDDEEPCIAPTTVSQANRGR